MFRSMAPCLAIFQACFMTYHLFVWVFSVHRSNRSRRHLKQNNRYFILLLGGPCRLNLYVRKKTNRVHRL